MWDTPKTDWTSEDGAEDTDFNRIEENIRWIELEPRTPNQSGSPAATGVLGALLDSIATLIRAITGKTNWYNAPATNLEATKSHIDSTAPHSATASATASRIILRDANGRAQVAAPSATNDIARKADVDGRMATAGGTFTGIVVAQNNTNYTTFQVRNIVLSTGNPTGGGNGDLWLKYTP